MDSLSKLFDGINRVKIMRLFLFNPADSYDKKDVVKKSKVSISTATSIVRQLEEAGMIKKKIFFKEIKQNKKTKKQENKKTKKRKTNGWTLDSNFSHLVALQNLLLNKELLTDNQIIKKIQKTGKIKLIVLSGVFVNRMEDSRADILIVGDKINKNSLERAIQDMESQIGKELSYAVFDSGEFYYRLDICDKLVRDILDYPHKKILKKTNVV